MSQLELIEKVSKLPAEVQEEVADFVNNLFEKHVQKAPKKELKFGMMKGSFVMADDFDEPLEAFKEYMP